MWQDSESTLFLDDFVYRKKGIILKGRKFPVVFDILAECIKELEKELEEIRKEKDEC